MVQMMSVPLLYNSNSSNLMMAHKRVDANDEDYCQQAKKRELPVKPQSLRVRVRDDMRMSERGYENGGTKKIDKLVCICKIHVWFSCFIGCFIHKMWSFNFKLLIIFVMALPQTFFMYWLPLPHIILVFPFQFYQSLALAIH